MSGFDDLVSDTRLLSEIKHHQSGGHRTVDPQTTIERTRPMMPELGITRVANVTGLDRIGIPVVMVCRPNARSIAVSQGKGIDLAAATASGIMEAAELHHAEHIANPLRLATRREMERSCAVIDIDRLPHVGDRPFDDQRQLLWIEGYDLMFRTERWVPFEIVSANYTLPPPPESGSLDRSTNGLASGNSPGEAVCHGICEAVERDASTLWNTAPAHDWRTTGLDPDTITDDACRRILGALEQAGMDVHVWETTSDIGVPSFFCALLDTIDPSRHVGIGAGTHPSKAIALTRALTEAVQVRMTYVSGTRDDIGADEYSDAGRAEKREAIERRISGTARRRDFSAIPEFLSDSFQDDLAWLLDRLRGVGVEQAVAVGLNRPEFGLNVARIVIPGLEPPDDHAAYRPGARAQSVMGSAA